MSSIMAAGRRVDLTASRDGHSLSSRSESAVPVAICAPCRRTMRCARCFPLPHQASSSVACWPARMSAAGGAERFHDPATAGNNATISVSRQLR